MEDCVGLDPNAVLASFDRSSPDRLLASIAGEIARLGQSNRQLAARVAALETLNVLVDRIAGAEQRELAAALPKSVIIDAVYSLPGSGGFYDLEYDPTGRPFRWTGPTRHFSFSCFVDRRNGASFLLEFWRIFAHVQTVAFQCLVDGEPVPTTVVQLPNGFELSGELPPRSGGDGSVLTFISPGIASPSEVDGVSDDRILGVAFQVLTITSSVANGQIESGDAAGTPTDAPLATTSAETARPTVATASDLPRRVAPGTRAA